MPRQILQLKLTLLDVAPDVWRRVLVPGGYTLDRVHRIIQYAMGWQNCHLHSFDVGGTQYGEPDPDELLDLRDELDVRLDAVAAKGQALRYLYDYGDWWEHRIDVEDIVDADPEQRYPRCVDGASACPPEDVGGPAGHHHLLAALGDPGHPDHDRMAQWLGRPFDPSFFDPTAATTLLRRLC